MSASAGNAALEFFLAVLTIMLVVFIVTILRQADWATSQAAALAEDEPELPAARLEELVGEPALARAPVPADPTAAASVPALVGPPAFLPGPVPGRAEPAQRGGLHRQGVIRPPRVTGGPPWGPAPRPPGLID